MIVAVVVAGVLAVVLGLRLRAALGRARELEAETASLSARLAAADAERDRLRSILDHAPDWVWATDEDGRVTFSAGAARLDLQRLEQPGFSGIVQRADRTLDTRATRTPDGWVGIDRDLTEPPPKRTPVVRRPVVNGAREVVGYEVIGDRSSYTPEELTVLAGGRRLWLSIDGEVPEQLAGAVIQLSPDEDPARARRLTEAGFTLALLETRGNIPAAYAKTDVRGLGDEQLRALLTNPAGTLVATGVDTAEEFTRCQVLGFALFQGNFFARPTGAGGTGASASLQALAELTTGEPSFEQLERVIEADVGLSVALLKHVNSAFFALPREIDTVREALVLLGARAVRRWATVVALNGTGAPDQLVALALLRARMCELLGQGTDEERERLFTVGLFSAADALLDLPMAEVLEQLPLSSEVRDALERHEGRRGRVLSTVLRYEQGHFPAGAGQDPGELAEAYLAALRWADDAGSWLG